MMFLITETCLGHMVLVRDLQTQSNNCMANALCSAYGLELMGQSMESNNTYKNFDSSRLFLYYNSRLKDKTTDQNVSVISMIP